MKHRSFYMILGLFSASLFAQTCPPASELFVKRNNGYDVIPPPGWSLVLEQRAERYHNFFFKVAAWGDHKHPIDNVRCHYYSHWQSSDHIQIETVEFLDQSRIPWRTNDLYALCVSQSDNVNECTFN